MVWDTSSRRAGSGNGTGEDYLRFACQPWLARGKLRKKKPRLNDGAQATFQNMQNNTPSRSSELGLPLLSSCALYRKRPAYFMLACLHMTTAVLNPSRRATRLRQGLECSVRLKLDGGASGRINRLGGHKVCPPAKLLIAIAFLNMGALRLILHLVLLGCETKVVYAQVVLT